MAEFIIRSWYVDSARGYDEIQVKGLDAAIEQARQIAHEKHVRSAAVLDESSTCWAQFNLLWMIPEEAR